MNEYGEKAASLRNALSIAFVKLSENGTIDGTTAGEHSEMFSEWVAGESVAVGIIRKYGTALYKCLQAHTTQAGWEPSLTPALWKSIADPAEEWPEWSQPISSTDAYQTGDKVSYQSKHYISLIDNNVWSPDAYPAGWSEQA